MLRPLVVLAFCSAAAFAQAPAITAVVNSADYSTNLCPGVLAAVFGSNFGTNGANVSASVGGRAAYLFTADVTPGQILVEIPFELSTGPTSLTVTVSGVASNAFSITLAATAPSFFTQNSSGTGLADVVTQSGALVTQAAPASPGQALTAYADGLGPTNPATATGLATASTPCATLPTVTVGGVAAPVTFAGVVAGYAGFYQVNFVVPSGVQGTVPLIITAGGKSSIAAITLALVGATCSFTLTPASTSLPPIGTSTVEVCPNSSGQPSCGVYPETPQSFTVTPNAACGPWTATSSVPEFLQVLSGASGAGPGTVSYAQLTNTHNGPQSNTITVGNGAASATYTVTLAGNADNETYRQIYALYEQFLGRDPDSGGFAFWSGVGGAGLGQMADDFLTSPEAFNTDFAVMAAYQAATGNGPTYAQYAAAAASIRAGAQTVPGLFNSLIGAGFTFATLYQNLLDRATAPADNNCIGAGLTQCFQTIVGYPANTTPVSALNNEFQSTGIYNKTDHTNALYVQMIYFVTLDRDPDPSGFAFWTGIANTGGPGLLFQGAAGYFYRNQILGPGTPNQGFIGSPEFQGLFAN